MINYRARSNNVYFRPINQILFWNYVIPSLLVPNTEGLEYSVIGGPLHYVTLISRLHLNVRKRLMHYITRIRRFHYDVRD